MNPRPLLAACALAIIALTAACTESNTGRLSLGFASRPATSGGALSLAAAGDSAVFALGPDTLIIRSLEVVLKEIELKTVEDIAGGPRIHRRQPRLRAHLATRPRHVQRGRFADGLHLHLRC